FTSLWLSDLIWKMGIKNVRILSGAAARRTARPGPRPVHGRAGAPRGQAEPGRLPPGLEYIPQKTAKNPMRPVGLAWAIGFPCGILLFVFTKRQVDRNRAKQLRARQNMRASNTGAYERHPPAPQPSQGPTSGREGRGLRRGD
uniref:PNKD metallo-beta-lactamase domain containing n=1 Tax=Ornithorhynchus anatinus TaxID=9258 RepID=F6UBF7_ORNAN